MTTLIISKGDTAVTIGTWCNPIISTSYNLLQGAELSYGQFGFPRFDRQTCPLKSKWTLTCYLVDNVKETLLDLIKTADLNALDDDLGWLLTMTDNIHTKDSFINCIFIPVNEYSESVIGNRWSIELSIYQV
jgi:hypothetical protein